MSKNEFIFSTLFLLIIIYTFIYFRCKDKLLRVIISAPILCIFLLSIAQAFRFDVLGSLYAKFSNANAILIFLFFCAALCILQLIFSSPHLLQQPTYKGCNQDERKRLLETNHHYLLNDCTDLKKHLITLSSSFIVFSATFSGIIADQDAPLLATVYWVLCIIFCFMSMSFSIGTNLRLCSKLSDASQTPQKIRHPSNAKELASLMYASICFIAACIVLGYGAVSARDENAATENNIPSQISYSQPETNSKQTAKSPFFLQFLPNEVQNKLRKRRGWDVSPAPPKDSSPQATYK